MHDQFRILDPHYALDLNDFDKIFFLERYHEFNSWLLDWCNSTRKSTPLFNESKQKKFCDENLVVVPQEDRLLYLHAKMINRLQCMRPSEVLRTCSQSFREGVESSKKEARRAFDVPRVSK